MFSNSRIYLPFFCLSGGFSACPLLRYNILCQYIFSSFSPNRQILSICTKHPFILITILSTAKREKIVDNVDNFVHNLIFQQNIPFSSVDNLWDYFYVINFSNYFQSESRQPFVQFYFKSLRHSSHGWPCGQ